MVSDRFTYRFMSRMNIQDELSFDSMGCLVHCIRDILLFHQIPSFKHMLTQPLSLVFEVNKDRTIWLFTQTESATLEPHFSAGLSTKWNYLSNYNEVVTSIRAFEEQGRITIFRTDWSNVKYSPIYLRRRGDWHHALAIAYYPAKDEFLIADRNDPENDPRFVDNRAFIPGNEFLTAFNNFFACLDYSFEEPKQPWSRELRQLIRDSIAAMSSKNSWLAPHQEYGFQALTHFSWFLQHINLQELKVSAQLQSFFRGHLPRNIHQCILGNRKLFFSVLNETYPLELYQMDGDTRDTQYQWQALALALIRFGRENDEKSRQLCLSHIEKLIAVEQRIVECLQYLLDHTEE